ncbi:syntaxin-11-like [Pungitius pungitius]|uniref:syntaxin-11-like n=1 Tax=Pungitius pungitius TaxID=134920 RepID=UPI001887B6F0|nr:syntaxin-11-like [Pungitius pungitius]
MCPKHFEEIFLLSDLPSREVKMRDMLQRLQTLREEQEDYEPEFYGDEYDVDKGTLSQQAVMFENTSLLDNILKEAQSIRKEISLLDSGVERLAINNERFGTSVRRLTLLKKDSDSIARGIQQRGGALHTRLQALGQESGQLEESEGPNSAVSRIARAQHDTLSHLFRKAMNNYHEAEEMQRSACRRRIKRQASILGTEITDEQLDGMVDKGGEGWTELSQSLQGARSTRWAMCEIKGRHKELVELEVRLKEVHDLFLDMAMLVEEQSSKVNNIEANVCGILEYTEKITVNIKRALQYKRKNPCHQCCPCLPCWNPNKLL